MSKTKILIAGIGGVGGYFGGLLARTYEAHNSVEIYFLARGTHLKAIQEEGLKVQRGEEEFICKPHLATNDALEIGAVDFVLLACKTYDLEALVNQIKPCITENTVILPLLNGVDSTMRVQEILPKVLVLQGCVYLVSRLVKPGAIRNTGNIEKLFFGLDGQSDQRIILLANLLHHAQIQVTLSDKISIIVWEKFIFISAIATATAYFDACIGALMKDKEKCDVIAQLLDEVCLLAAAKKHTIAIDIKHQSLTKLSALPYQTTTSMHSDFKQKKTRTELQALCGYVVRESNALQVATPTFNTLFSALNARLK